MDPQIKAYNDLIAGIKEKIATNELELQASRGITDAEKERLSVQKLVEKGTITQAQADSALTKALLERLEVTELDKKQALEAVAARDKTVEAMDREIDKLRDEVRAQLDANAVIGKSEVQLADFTAAKLTDAAATKDRLAALADEIDWSGQLGDMYREQAKSLRELGAAKRDGAARKEAFEEEKKIWESLDRTAHDVWTNIWEGGSNVFKKLGQTLKASLLDLLYQMTVKKWIFNIFANITGGASGMAGAAATGAMQGGMGGIGNILSLAGIGGNFSGGISAGISSIFGSGTVMGGLDAGFTALGAGNIMGGIGTLMPYVGIALAAYSIMKGAFKGETRSGGKYTDDKFLEGPSGGEINGEATRKAITATEASINAMLKGMGSSLMLGTLESGFESSKNGKGFAYAGGNLSDGTMFGQNHGLGYMNRRGSMTPEEAAAAYTEEMKQATLQAIQAATDIPDSVAKLLKDKDIDKLAGAELDALLAQVDTIITGVGNFRTAIALLPFDKLAGQSFDFAAGLGEMSGGMDKFLGNLGTYYQNFYSKDEQTAQTRKNIQGVITAAGGGDISGITDRASYRKLVEQYEGKTDEASMKIYTALLSVAGAFASITDAAEEAGKAMRSASDIASERYDLETELLQLEGNTAELRRRELEALDESNRALKERIYKLQDEKAAAEEAEKQRNALTLQAGQIYANVGDIALAAAEAARKAADEWGATAQSIEDVMRQLRGDLMGPERSLAQLQSQFAIATAAARAGDRAAADSLPALAQQIAQLGGSQAGSAFEQQVMTANLLASLGSTLNFINQFQHGIPSYDVGTPYVPRTGFALVHQGERITPADQNVSNAGNEANRQAEARAMVQLLSDLRRRLDKWEVEGLPQARVEG